jgi:hypothetical protein
MEVSLQVPVSLCEAKINDIDLIIMVTDTHHDIAGLDITVNYVTRVDILDA